MVSRIFIWLIFTLSYLTMQTTKSEDTEQLVNLKQRVGNFSELLNQKLEPQIRLELSMENINWKIVSLEDIILTKLQNAETRIMGYMNSFQNRLNFICWTYEEGFVPLDSKKKIKMPDFINGSWLSPVENNSGIILHYSPEYRTYVSNEKSAIHIPNEEFEGSKQIKHDIKWSGEVQLDANTGLDLPHWEYVGLQTGVFRLFPTTPLAVDCTYDSRLEEWFIKTAMAPKMVYLALDTSGSVQGMVLELIRRTSMQLLETLTDSDFVKVVSFSDQVRELTYCKDGKKPRSLGFIRATRKNILALKRLIGDNLRAEFKANFVNLFETMFRTFHNETQELKRYGACSRVALVMTDGGEIDLDQIARMKQKARMDDVSVFTYGEGPESYAMPNVAHLACENRGIYHEIPNIDAIRYQSYQYMKILYKQVAKDYYSDYRLSEPNLQPWSKPHWLVLSMTCPISSQTGRKQFIGVSGIDFPISQLDERGVFSEGFPSVELFISNERGNILTHSILNSVKHLPLKKTMKVSLADIFDFASEEDREEFIEKLLSDPENKTIAKKAFANIGLYAYEHVVRISFKTQKENVYFGKIPVAFAYWTKLAISAEDNSVFNDEIIYDVKTLLYSLLPGEKVPREFNTPLEISPDNFNIANWPYCPKKILWVGATQEELSRSILDALEVISEDSAVCFSSDGRDALKTDTLLFQNLISSLYLAKQFINKNFDIGNITKPELDSEIFAEYLITFGGVSYISDVDISTTSWWHNNKDPKSSGLYQRAMMLWETAQESNKNTKFEFTFVTRLQLISYEGLTEVHADSLFATKCAEINNDYEDISGFGNLTDPIFLNKILFHSNEDETRKAPYAIQGQIMGRGQFIERFVPQSDIFSSYEQVFVLDEGAYIVAFNLPDNDKSKDTIQVGDHFSKSNGCLLADLVKHKIYKKHRNVNNYCSCIMIEEDEEKSPSRRPTSMFTLAELVTKLFSLCTGCLAAFSSSFWHHLTHSLFYPHLPRAQEYISPSMTPTPCSFAFNKYYFNRLPTPDDNYTPEGTFESSYRTCGPMNCYCEAKRIYKVINIPNTNLLLVSASSLPCRKCEKEKAFKELVSHTPIEKVRYQLCDYEDIALKKRPDGDWKCPKIPQQEDHCLSGFVQGSMLLIITNLLLAFLLIN